MSSNNDGLSLRYRITWRLNWLLLHVAGPADLGDVDPRRRMERERAERVARARAVREVGAGPTTAAAPTAAPTGEPTAALAAEPTAATRAEVGSAITTPPTAPDQPFTGAV